MSALPQPVWAKIVWKRTVARENRAKRKARLALGTKLLFDAKFEDIWRAVNKKAA
jgi:hypothetical protein